MKKIIFFIVVLLGVYFYFIAPPGTSTEDVVFIVPKNEKNVQVVNFLQEKKLVKHTGVAQFIYGFIGHVIEPGGYRLNRGMNVVQVIQKIAGKPDMVWVSINYCLRKEHIGEILAKNLEWSDSQVAEWNTLYSDPKHEYYEGVYYPDTYLIPKDESPKEVSKRFINRFNEQFGPYAQKYVDANIRWVTGLRIASLIAREAAGAKDMHLISGVIWNRLNIGMPLQIDATMQYTAGKRNGNWWAPVDLVEKQSDSPYNTYKVKGLPPTPICSPSIAYIEAALNPAETECLFYLHDKKGDIYCAKTYEEHKENIERYLR